MQEQLTARGREGWEGVETSFSMHLLLELRLTHHVRGPVLRLSLSLPRRPLRTKLLFPLGKAFCLLTDELVARCWSIFTFKSMRVRFDRRRRILNRPPGPAGWGPRSRLRSQSLGPTEPVGVRAGRSRCTSPKDPGRGWAVGVLDVKTGARHRDDALKLQVGHIVSVSFWVRNWGCRRDPEELPVQRTDRVQIGNSIAC